MTYATDRLFEEVAYVAYHFHWPMDTILDLEHPDRRLFLAEASALAGEMTPASLAPDRGD